MTTPRKKPPKASTKKHATKKKAPARRSTRAASDARVIDKRPSNAPTWQSQHIDHIRSLIRQADPDATEDIKWRKPSNNMLGVPVWSHNGIICTGETYKGVVKLTFAQGASLPDPHRLFNASLEGSTRRAIDLGETDSLNKSAFIALIRAAVAFNQANS